MTSAHERRSYEQFCPVARALDLLGERWTLLVVRELLAGPCRFTDLRAHLPGMSPALLTQRLRALEDEALVRRTELPPPAARTVYELTERGRALEPVVYELGRFGIAYLTHAGPTPQPPMHLLALGLKLFVVLEALPGRAFVVHLALDEGDFTLRISAPAHGPAIGRVAIDAGTPAQFDARVRASLSTILWLRQGVMTLAEARAGGLLEVNGPARGVAAACALFGLETAA